MKCSICGAELNPNGKFCQSCGAAVNQPIQQQPMQQPMQQQYNPGNGQFYNGPMPNQNFGGQQYANNMGYTANGSGNNIVKICIIVVVVVAALVGVGFLLFNKLGISTYSVNFEGYKFNIPNNLKNDIDTQEKVLMVGNQEETWVAQIRLQTSAPFEQVKKNKSSVRQKMLQSLPSGTLSEPQIENIGGTEFLTMNASYAGTNSIIAFAALNSTGTIVIEVMTEDNEHNKDLLKTIAPIVKNVEQNGGVKKIKTNGLINLVDITQ